MKWWMIAGATLVMLVTGCAGHPAVPDSAPPAQAVAAPEPSTDSVPASAPYLVRVSDHPIQVAQAPAIRSMPAEEPLDPFAKADEEDIEEYDPWESLNTKVFDFNLKVDRWVLKPVAQGYNAVVPNIVQLGISNIFSTIRFPPRFFNNLFQGKVKGAGIEVGRFLVNATLGFAGFFDVAKDMDLNTPEEDTGQTLGVYGVKPGPYLVLPLLPPFTVRDFAGFWGDIALNPINWLVAPIIEVEGIPSAIAHKNRMTITLVQVGGRAYEILNDRSLNLEKYQGVEEATLDLYTAVRNAYLQKRAKAIKE